MKILRGIVLGGFAPKSRRTERIEPLRPSRPLREEFFRHAVFSFSNQLRVESTSSAPRVSHPVTTMKFSLASFLLIFGLMLSVTRPAYGRAESVAVMVGTAKVDITPELPIHLTGFESRKVEATRAETRLFARALAIGSDEQKPAVLITLEVIGVGAETSEIVATALRRQHGIERERLALSVIHTHTGPTLSDVLPYMFARDLPAEETARINRYTAELRVKLIQLATDALANRQPSHLAWGQGTVGFAAQRRVVVDGLWKSFGVTPEGPVDHAVRLLLVTFVDCAVLAVFLNYAFH